MQSRDTFTVIASQELRDLKEMLKSEPGGEDQQYVRRAIDKFRRGENRKRLAVVHVVGVSSCRHSHTCAKVTSWFCSGHLRRLVTQLLG